MYARSEGEIEEVYKKAQTQVQKGGSKWRGQTYEQGVRDTIEWIFGQTDDNPMEDAD